MTTNPERPLRGARHRSPSLHPHHRCVILHSHPRFVDMMHEFAEEFSAIPPDCVFSFDLNRLPEPSGLATAPDTDAGQAAMDEPLLSLQVSRADRIYLGIEAGNALPPVWKLALSGLLKSRPHVRGSIVLLEDMHPDPELVDFLETVASDTDLDLIQWRRPAKPAADGSCDA